MNEIKEFIKTIPEKKEHIDNEEQTKLSIINPFLRKMGYDTEDPTIVKAEYTADAGIKNGEKVDYAIMDNNKPLILIEAKTATKKLNEKNIEQLFRYYGVTDAKIAILTNGIELKVFTSKQNSRLMNKEPFITIDLTNMTEKELKELEKFKAENLNIEKILEENKFKGINKAIKTTIENELNNPSDEFIELIINKIDKDNITENIKSEIKEKIKKEITKTITEKNSNKKEEITKIKINPKELDKTHKSIKDKPENIKEMFNEIIESINNKYPDTEMCPSKIYTAFKNKKTKKSIVSIAPTKTKIVTIINIKKINDEKNLTRNVSNIGHWAVGDYEYKIRNKEDIKYFMFLAEQAYKEHIAIEKQ